MISKTDIAITFYHKNYFELNEMQRNVVDNAYNAHLDFRDKALMIFDD